MSFHKAIASGKEKRKEYIGKDYCKSVDTRCQNHGGRYHGLECEWCKGNRLYKARKLQEETKSKLGDNNE